MFIFYFLGVGLPCCSARFIYAGVWGRRVLPTALPAPLLRHSESGPLGLSVRECGAAGSAGGQAACPVPPTLRQSRSHHGHASPLCPSARLRPSYGSGCMFLFYLLGVGLPCCSIFCQFWLCEEVQCVYICRHLGSSSCFPFRTKNIRSSRSKDCLSVVGRVCECLT